MLSEAHGMDPSGSRKDDTDVDLHITESRQWLGGSPVMHRDRLTRDSLLHRHRNTLLRCPRRPPTDPRPTADSQLERPARRGASQALKRTFELLAGFRGMQGMRQPINPVLGGYT